MSTVGLRPLVKICGVTKPTDILACANAGVNWIGLNFHPPSRRYLSSEQARSLLVDLPPSLEAVGVFVDRSGDEILRIAETVGFQIVQLHGDEPPKLVRALARSLRVVKAFRIENQNSLNKVQEYLKLCRAIEADLEAILIDSPHPGTGTEIEPDLIAAYGSFPRLILAGGLQADNVGERVRRYRPWMVDVAAGVESEPGLKDPRLISAFVQAARGERG